MHEILKAKLDAALSEPLPVLTRRDVHLPDLPGKALAVVGVRRAGKTSLLHRILQERLEAGAEREALVLFGLEDDRLADPTVEHLDWLVEEYFRRQPGLTCPQCLYHFQS